MKLLQDCSASIVNFRPQRRVRRRPAWKGARCRVIRRTRRNYVRVTRHPAGKERELPDSVYEAEAGTVAEVSRLQL